MRAKSSVSAWEKAKAVIDNQPDNKTSFEGLNMTGGTGHLMKPRKKKKRK